MVLLVFFPPLYDKMSHAVDRGIYIDGQYEDATQFSLHTITMRVGCEFCALCRGFFNLNIAYVLINQEKLYYKNVYKNV